jgi:hypothetical protein
MRDSNTNFQIGGLILRLSDTLINQAGRKFSKELGRYLIHSAQPADLCLFPYKCDSVELLIQSSNAAPVYEFEFGSLKITIYPQKPSGYIWALATQRNFTYLAYSIDSYWKTFSLLVDNTRSEGTCAFDHFADIFSYSAIALGGIVFHGVVMEYQGQGVILSAPSGTGKTTHSNIWLNLGLSTIINGDRALCRYINGSWTAFGMPWCGSSGISENRQVPIQAIVVLEQYNENIVDRLKPFEALKMLLPNVYAPKWEPALYNKMLDRLNEIIPAVPIFRLQCRPDMDAVWTLKSALDSLPRAQQPEGSMYGNANSEPCPALR